MLNGYRLSHAGADLQKFGNLEDEAEPLFASSSGSVSNGHFANAKVATTQSSRLPKEGRNTDSRTKKRAKVAKWSVSETAVARAAENKPKRSLKSDDVLDGSHRDLDERTRRDLDESDDE